MTFVCLYLPMWFWISFKVSSSSSIKIRNCSNEGLFNFLCGWCTLNPQSVESRTFLFNKISEKYNGHQWTTEYEDQISALIHSYAVNLNRKWSKCNRTMDVNTVKNLGELEILLNTRNTTNDEALPLHHSVILNI